MHAGQSLEVEEDVEDDDKGPSVLYSEFEKPLEELKNKKATGPDGIPAELLKVLGSAGKRELFEICNEIYTMSKKLCQCQCYFLNNSVKH